MSSGTDLPVRADLEKVAELASVSVSKPVAAVNSDLESIATGGEPVENGYGGEDGNDARKNADLSCLRSGRNGHE